MHAWIVALIFLCLSPESEYWEFDRIADAVERVSLEHPLFAGEDGPERTAAELVAVAARESHFVVGAVGRDAYGRSLGLWQVHETNLGRLVDATYHDAVRGRDWHFYRGAIEGDLDVDVQVRFAVLLLEESHRACRDLPLEDQLSEYASGMGRCDMPEGLRDSRNRTRLAAWLVRTRPRFWVDSSPEWFDRRGR